MPILRHLTPILLGAGLLGGLLLMIGA